jgi:hypothetical protein
MNTLRVLDSLAATQPGNPTRCYAQVLSSNHAPSAGKVNRVFGTGKLNCGVRVQVIDGGDGRAEAVERSLGF